MLNSKSKALAIIPKCTGALSLIGSMYIFQDIIINRSERRQKYVYHGIVLGLSVFDMMASITNILSTWPMPHGSPGVYGAVGTTETCTLQGFFAEVGNICTPLYNASLCAHHMLVIISGWPKERLKKNERLFHIVPLLFGWTLGISGLPFEAYNNSGWLCWFAPFPGSCHHDNVECERGATAYIFRWLHYSVVWSAILFVTVSMILIYREVASKERATVEFTNFREEEASERRRSRSRNSIERRKNSKAKKVANQGMLFVSALYLTWIFTTVARIFQVTRGKSNFYLLVLMAIFFPLQGFWNAIIFLRPRYVRYSSAYPEKSVWEIIILVLFPRPSSRDGDLEALASTNFSTTARASSMFTVATNLRRLSAPLDINVKDDPDINVDGAEPSKEVSVDMTNIKTPSRQQGVLEDDCYLNKESFSNNQEKKKQSPSNINTNTPKGDDDQLKSSLNTGQNFHKKKKSSVCWASEVSDFESPPLTNTNKKLVQPDEMSREAPVSYI